MVTKYTHATHTHRRGAVCLIGKSIDLFISLARHGEHQGWESSMTVVGQVILHVFRYMDTCTCVSYMHTYTHTHVYTLTHAFMDALYHV